MKDEAYVWIHNVKRGEIRNRLGVWASRVKARSAWEREHREAYITHGTGRSEIDLVCGRTQ